jgi:hypothetical protein
VQKKNDQATRKSPGHILWVRASSLLLYKEDSLKLYKIEFALELVKLFLNGRLVKMMIFPNLYRERTNRGAKNNQATRKSPGHITWVRTLSLFLYKEDPPKLYKIEFSLELVNGF